VSFVPEEMLTSNYVTALTRKVNVLGDLVRSERKRRRDEHDLLLAALHQLAEIQGARDRQAFARNWIARERRSWRRDPLPIDRKKGGEDQAEVTH